MEFAFYMMLHLRADWATGIYRGCALTLAYQFGAANLHIQVKDALLRLKRKKYINYSPDKGRKGAYEILIHKYEPRVGRLSRTRLNAWKHEGLAKPEYEPLASDAPEARLRLAGESPEARTIQEVRTKEVRNKSVSPSSRKKALKSLPENFGISDNVRTWAKEQGHGRLEEHLEQFIGTAKAKGYQYVDWDQALMNAIRKDWAKLGSTTAAEKLPSTYVSPSERHARDLVSRTGGVQ